MLKIDRLKFLDRLSNLQIILKLIANFPDCLLNFEIGGLILRLIIRFIVNFQDSLLNFEIVC